MPIGVRYALGYVVLLADQRHSGRLLSVTPLSGYSPFLMVRFLPPAVKFMRRIVSSLATRRFWARSAITSMADLHDGWGHIGECTGLVLLDNIPFTENSLPLTKSSFHQQDAHGLIGLISLVRAIFGQCDFFSTALVANKTLSFISNCLNGGHSYSSCGNMALNQAKVLILTDLCCVVQI